ncbi:hypothetical protein NM208_g9140 [Fusarium decemcellulare]|uniref:Uncharacterized protein n=1 Tax=Fusarium decemcellulare TaxID=57161 RepID=A0ACC1S2P1_9HYPO|nr:hypothetical protein NM208_g9140 [Fusarium decemcellulare]
MMRSYTFAALALSATGYATNLKVPRGWTQNWKNEPLVQVSDDCIVSHATRYDMVKGNTPVFFSTSPHVDFERPAIEPMNSTAGEQWEFDGISDDGLEGFVFGFYRDPNYSFLGTGNLRLSAEWSFSDGSRYAVVEYAEESTIESCPGRGTRGTWKGDNWVYTFEISSDLSRTRITMDNPEAKGTIAWTSASPPRYADGSAFPDETEGADLEAVPHFYWVEPVPVSDLILNAEIEGRKVSWTGMGGHERLWGAFNWYTCLSSMIAVRLRLGPFALSLVEFGSNRVDGLIVPSVILAEEGKKIFSSRSYEPSETEDFIRVRNVYDAEGVTTSNLLDKVTGIELELVSPSRGLWWEFFVTHKNLGFEYNLGEGVGGTGYSGVVSGGLAGSKRYQGPAFTEFLKFPQKSMILTKNFVTQ